MKYLILFIFLLFASLVRAEIWACSTKDGGERITNTPVASEQASCRPLKGRIGVFNRVSVEAFERISARTLGELPRSRLSDSTSGESKGGLGRLRALPRVSWKAREVDRKTGRQKTRGLNRECELSGVVSVRGKRAVILEIQRGALTLEQHRVSLVAGKAKWKVRLRGACRRPNVRVLRIE